MYLIGVRVDNLMMQEVLQKIRGFLVDGRQHYIVTPNPEFLVRARKDEEFREILNKADLAVPDGIGLIWASKFLGQPLKERVSGTDLITRIMNSELGIKNNKIFLLGGRNGVAEKIARNWPEVVGYSENQDDCLDLINQCQPNILFVALGAPKQEKWIVQNLKSVPSVRVAIGVGGAFDFLSGRISRAPRFTQKIGLEWLWRFCQQPRRLPRILNAIIIFPFLVFLSKFKIVDCSK